MLEGEVNRKLRDSRVRAVVGAERRGTENKFEGLLIQSQLSRGGHLEEVRSHVVLRGK